MLILKYASGSASPLCAQPKTAASSAPLLHFPRGTWRRLVSGRGADLLSADGAGGNSLRPGCRGSLMFAGRCPRGTGSGQRRGLSRAPASCGRYASGCGGQAWGSPADASRSALVTALSQQSPSRLMQRVRAARWMAFYVFPRDVWASPVGVEQRSVLRSTVAQCRHASIRCPSSETALAVDFRTASTGE